MPDDEEPEMLSIGDALDAFALGLLPLPPRAHLPEERELLAEIDERAARRRRWRIDGLVGLERDWRMVRDRVQRHVDELRVVGLLLPADVEILDHVEAALEDLAVAIEGMRE